MNIETVELDLSDMIQYIQTGAKLADSFRYPPKSEESELEFRKLRDILEGIAKALINDMSKWGNIKSQCELSDSCIEPLKGIVSSFDGRSRLTGIDPRKSLEKIQNPDDIKGFGEL